MWYWSWRTCDATAPKGDLVSGRDAAQQVLAEATREEFIAAELVARALRTSSRTLLRDWRRRCHPETRVGRSVLLPAGLVLRTYFPHHVPLR